MTRTTWISLFLFAALLFAQGKGGKATMPECGMGDKDHPCKCMIHTEEVQQKYLSDCKAEKLSDPKAKFGRVAKECLATMPDHCSIVEHYGNWATDDQGNHTNPMPMQCTKSCTRSHCKCADGPTCHFAHSPSEDNPPPKRKR